MSNKVYGFYGLKLNDIFWNDDATEETPAKPTCPMTHRVKTAAEAGIGVSLFEKIGGQEAHFLCRTCDGRSEYLVGEARYELYPDWLVSTTQHSFVQNGCRKSWCTHCDCEGLFDFESGTFKPV